MEKFFEDKSIISEEQSGFRRGRGCRDNVFVLDFLIKKRIIKGERLFAFFIDFVSAFPSVDHELLWVKMEKNGFSDKFINLCKSFYNIAKMAIRTEQGLTDEVSVTRGVLQGETLSSGLFLNFINDLIEFLINFDLKGVDIDEKNEVQALGYADDFVMFATDFIEMNRKIEVIQLYCEQNLLKINTSKSKMLIFQRGRHKIYNFSLKNEKIKIVSKFNYLGIEFSRSGLYNTHFNRIKSSANLAIASTIATIKVNKICNWEAITMLCNSLVNNLLTYCSEIWGLWFLKEIDNIQLSFYRNLFWLVRSVPFAAIRTEFRIKHQSVEILKRSLNWLEKVDSMNNKRLPKICLKKSCKIPEQSKKFIWVNKIIDLFEKENIICGKDIKEIVENKEKLLLEYENCIILKDWLAFMETKNLVINKELIMLKIDSNYFNLNLNFNTKRILINVRLLVKNFGKIYIDGKMIAFKENECCKFCNLPNEWNIKHMLTDCLNTKQILEKFFERDEIHYFDYWLKILNSDDVILLRKFVIIFHKLAELLQ